jgi:hypothetical protein
VAIVATDLKRRLTTTAGSSGNSTAQGSPDASLGKYVSTTDLTDATLQNLFDAVSGDDNAASEVEYRALGFYNAHGSLTYQAVKAWLSSETAGGASLAIGLDPVGVVAVTAIAGTSIANEDTAPAGVTFSAPTTKGAGLSVGDVPAGSCFILWLRRTAANTAALDTDGAVVAVEGDTAA